MFSRLYKTVLAAALLGGAAQTLAGSVTTPAKPLPAAVAAATSPWQALRDELAHQQAVGVVLSGKQVMAVGASVQASAQHKPSTVDAAQEKQSRQRILALLKRIQASDKAVTQQFAENQAWISKKHFPARIQERQQQAQTRFQQGSTALASVQQELEQADRQNQSAAWSTGIQHLEKLVAQWQPTEPAVNAKQAPWSSPHLKVRGPHTSKDDYLQSLSMFGIKPLQVAGPIPSDAVWPVLPTLPAQPQDADTQATIDAQLTPAIVAKAAALNYNPSKIYRWVHDNIIYVPSYGSMQGADYTLKSGRGNDMDTASLLIALLRASNIPARYVYGTIEVPLAQAENWVGGAPDANAVLSLLAQGGVPSTAVTTGGSVSAIQLEHVWVEAFVDFVPSRGVSQRISDTWIPLDPSFKQYTFSAPLNIASAVPFNAQGLLTQLQTPTTVNQGGVVQNLNAAAVQQVVNSYQQNVQAYLQNYPALTVAGVMGSGNANAYPTELLPNALPYQLDVVAGDFAALPDTLRWQWRLNLYGSAADQSNGNPAVHLQGNLPTLLGHRLDISFRPATNDDSQVLAGLLPAPHSDGSPIQPSEYPSSIPAYLINMTAQLFQDGQLLQEGGSVTLGAPLLLESAAYDPASANWVEGSADTVNAGELHAITLDTGMSPSLMQAQQAQLDQLRTQVAAGNVPTSLDALNGVLLSQMGSNYFGLLDSYEQWMIGNQSLVGFRRPSWGRVATEVDPQYVQGVILSASFPGAQIRLDHLESALVGANGAQAALPYRNAAAERLSLYSQTALQRSLQTVLPNGSPVSSVHALATALKNGQALYSLNNQNAATLTPNLALSASEQPAVSNAVAAGQQVLLSQTPVALGSWSGRGLLYQNSVLGSSRFTVSNGATALWYDGNASAWLAFGPGQGILPALDATSTLNGQLQITLGNSQNIAWAQFNPANDLINGGLLTQLHAQTGSGSANTANPNLLPHAASLLATDSAMSQPINLALNPPPVISSTPGTAGSTDLPYQYSIVASSPAGNALSYEVVKAPTLVQLDAGGNLSWAKPLLGSWPLTVRVSDGKAFATQDWTLIVSQGPAPLQVDVSVQPKFANAGDAITIFVSTTGGRTPMNTTLTVDGQTVPVDAHGQAFIMAPTAVGNHTITATVADVVRTVTQSTIYAVKDPADTNVPQLAITSPAIDAQITSPVLVTGTVQDSQLAYYQLMIKPIGAPVSAFKVIHTGTSNVVNGLLGTLDPTTMQNGLYDLGLVAYNSQGQQISISNSIEIAGKMKLGQFMLKYTDMILNAPGGMPLQITRTYDTRRDHQALDFGYGWSVSYQDITVRKNVATGLSWEVRKVPNSFTVCLVPVFAHNVIVTLPDGTLYHFRASNATQCQTGTPPLPNVQFTALDSSATLVANNPPILDAQGGNLIDPNTGGPWDPSSFTLTLQDGTAYTLDQDFGIREIKTPYGNTLTFSNSGITSNSGQGITFIRDSQNRITAITDPSGKSIQYVYDENGNLSAVTDRLGQQGAYTYNADHAITSYIDPRGITLERLDYDDQGRLVSITDSQGRSTQLTIDLPNNIQVVKDRMGNATQYTFDDQGDVVQKVDALGNKTTYTYDANGNQTSVTDALGHTTTTTYATDLNNSGTYNKELAETDALGHQRTYQYASNGNPTQSTDFNGNATSYTYFGNGTASMTLPGGFGVTAGMDGQGRMTRMQVAGQTVQLAYDSAGNQISKTSPLGVVTNFTYDANGKQTGDSYQRTQNVGLPTATTVTVSTQRTYDANGNILSSVDAQGQKTVLTYNSANQVATETDNQGRTISYTYDDNINLIRTDYPDRTAEVSTYDANKNQTSFTDRNGHTTNYDYDALNRLIKTTFPDGSFTGTKYDAVGNVVSTTDSQGHGNAATFDAAGHQVTSTDANGNTLTYAYDANGNRTSETDANGQVTQYQYDVLNRLVKTILPDGSFRSITYRVDGVKQSEADENGNIHNFVYDVEGKLTGVTIVNPNGAVQTTYGYDEAGNKISQSDANGHVTRWQYDLSNRLVGRTLPDSRQETYSYDALGNMTQHKAFDGSIAYFAYDAMGRKLLAAWPDGRQVRYTYTSSGQVASTIMGATAPTTSGFQPNGTTSYIYDVNDRPVRVSFPNGRYIAYAYDNVGNLVSRATADGTWTYSYDPAQRLSQVADPQGMVTIYGYEPSGRLSKTTYPDGSVRLQEYNGNGQLLQIATKNAQGTLLSGTVYSLLPNGQRQGLTRYDAGSAVNASTSSYTNPTTGKVSQQEHWSLSNPATVITYQYDYDQRLSQELVKDFRNELQRQSAWTYDGVGNRIGQMQTVTPVDANGGPTGAGSTSTTSYTYDATDRLQQSVLTPSTGNTITTTYQWDANGRLIQKATPSQLTQYTWRGDDRLVQVQQGSDASHLQTVATYSYDDFGNRVQRTTFVQDPSSPSNGVLVPQVTDYLVDNNFSYAETLEEIKSINAGQTGRTLYTWGNDLIGASVDSSVTGSSVQTYYQPDGLGSIITTSNPQGQVTASYRYGAFGQAYGVSSGDANAYHFAGEYLDASVGLQYHRARWYDPETALFLSMDSDPGLIEQPKTLPRFVYAAADPVNKIDPSGTTTLGEVMTATEETMDMAGEAMYAYQNIFGNPDDDGADNGPPTFFDNLLAYLVRVIGTSLGHDDNTRNISAVLGWLGNIGPKEAHHTIPKYVCGHQQQLLSRIPVLVHRSLHSRLYAFPVVIDATGYSLKLLIFKRVGRPIPTPTQIMGRKRIGRAAIAGGLADFYTHYDYWGDGAPPIGVAFDTEVTRFVLYHYNPACEL